MTPAAVTADSEHAAKDITLDDQATDLAHGSIREQQDRFIAVWSSMGADWGIPRTMAEIHALLYITATPYNTDQIMDRLGISRGNASMSLRSLVEWGLVRRVHRKGDRKEYFEAEQEIATIFRAILRERKKREFDPLINTLQQCRCTPANDVHRSSASASAGTRDRKAPAADRSDQSLQQHNQRLDDMLRFLHLIDRITHAIAGDRGIGVEKTLALLAKVVR